MNLKGCWWMVGPGSLLVVWVIITTWDLVDPIFLASPVEVGKALGSLTVAEEGNLWAAVLVTLFRALTGLSLGILIGMPLGLVLGYFSRAYSMWQLPLDFFRSVPVTALFPLFLLVFGVGNQGKIVVVAWAVTLLMTINTIYGVRGCSSIRRRYLQSIGARPLQVMVYHILPEAAPSILGGLRVSISQAFIVVIVTEMFLGANSGIGYLLYSSALMYHTDDVIALILVTGILGYGINKIAEMVGTKVVFWRD